MIAALQRQMEWRAVPIAGLAAGAAHLLVLALLAPAFLSLNIGVILRYIASLVMGSAAVTSTDAGPLIAGLLVHFVLSIFFALVIAIIIHRWGLVVGILGGAILGLCLYAINYFTFTLAFPWMYALNSPLMLLTHVVFGAVAGGVYEALDHFDMPLQSGEGA